MSKDSQIAHSQNDKLVVVYDGECNFCINQVNKIRKMDDADQFIYLPRQTPGIEDKYPILNQGDFNSGMRAITADNECFVGADAIFEISKRLPQTRWFSWLYPLPVFNQLAKLGYKIIAANRKRLAKSCDTGACPPS